MKSIARIGVFLFLLVFVASFAWAQGPNEMYQVATVNALLQGGYDGETTIKELKQHGDFGLGTFNQLDGEMVVIDGKCYQIKSTGQVVEADGNVKTPFAAVIQFKPEFKGELQGIEDYSQLEKSVGQWITERNYFYAVRIDGLFSYVKTRSVPAQTRPYRPLAEVAKEQAIFEMENVKGTIIGFWCPQYINGINVPGFHLHFISDDRQRGGHLLGASLQNGTIRLARLTRFEMVLPDAADFRDAVLDTDRSKELQKVEKDK